MGRCRQSLPRRVLLAGSRTRVPGRCVRFPGRRRCVPGGCMRLPGGHTRIRVHCMRNPIRRMRVADRRMRVADRRMRVAGRLQIERSRRGRQLEVRTEVFVSHLLLISNPERQSHRVHTATGAEHKIAVVMHMHHGFAFMEDTHLDLNEVAVVAPRTPRRKSHASDGMSLDCCRRCREQSAVPAAPGSERGLLPPRLLVTQAIVAEAEERPEHEAAGAISSLPVYRCPQVVIVSEFDAASSSAQGAFVPIGVSCPEASAAEAVSCKVVARRPAPSSCCPQMVLHGL
jgi:hypothetical protein